MKTGTPIEDVRDPRGFSAAVVRRLSIRLTEAEQEEAVSEGVVLLYELHGRWDPERCASFYAFCTTYLPLRLIDWWRKEMRQANLAHRAPDGKGYVYHGRVSLDELNGDDWTAAEDYHEKFLARQLITQDSHRLGD